MIYYFLFQQAGMFKLFILIFTITLVSLFCNCEDVKEENLGLELLRHLMASPLAKQKNPKAMAYLLTSLKAEFHQIISNFSSVLNHLAIALMK